MFRDSKKTDSYNKSYIYSTDSLDGDWAEWKKTLDLSTGATINKIATIPNTDLLMAFCEYDWLYHLRKNLRGDRHFAYCFSNNKWQYVEIDDNPSFDRDLHLKKFNDNYYLYNGGYVYTSNNANVWQKRDDLPRYTGKCFEINDSLFLLEKIRDQEYYLSHNLEEYKKFELEKGSWHHFEINQHQILAVYRAEHIQKPFLRLGAITIDSHQNMINNPFAGVDNLLSWLNKSTTNGKSFFDFDGINHTQ